MLASTPDVAAIAQAITGEAADVRVIMPAGADVHSFTVSSEQVRSLQQAALVLFANSQDLGFEQTLKSALGKTPSLDWPDYEAEGASLRDYPDYPRNPHGPWLRLDNAAAMARAMARAFVRLGLPKAVIESNQQQFERELAAQQAVYIKLADDHRLRERPLLVVIPGLCDLIANMDVPVGAVLMAEGSGTVSGQTLADAVTKLKTGQYGGIVCPLSMKQSKQGEAARQVAADSGAPVAYVRFQDTNLERDTYLSVSAYNAAALAALGGGAAKPAAGQPAIQGLSWPWLALLAVAVLLIGLLIGLKTRRSVICVHGAGIFEDSADGD